MRVPSKPSPKCWRPATPSGRSATWTTTRKPSRTTRRIGDVESLAKKYANTKTWAAGEQKGVESADRAVIEKLAEGNTAYEEKFGHIFIVCATGKSAAEMLAMLEARMKNDPKDEILIAAAEQNKITRLRLKKLLA